LTIRFWVVDGWRTKAAVKLLAASAARSSGVAILLSGDLETSGGLVDAALAASDHGECAVNPAELGRALERARAVLWPRRQRRYPVLRVFNAAGIAEHEGLDEFALRSRSWSGGRDRQLPSRRRGA
jgi:hypothetical protein